MDLELDENQRAIADLALQILRESLTARAAARRSRPPTTASRTTSGSSSPTPGCSACRSPRTWAAAASASSRPASCWSRSGARSRRCPTSPRSSGRRCRSTRSARRRSARASCRGVIDGSLRPRRALVEDGDELATLAAARPPRSATATAGGSTARSACVPAAPRRRPAAGAGAHRDDAVRRLPGRPARRRRDARAHRDARRASRCRRCVSPACGSTADDVLGAPARRRGASSPLDRASALTRRPVRHAGRRVRRGAAAHRRARLGTRAVRPEDRDVPGGRAARRRRLHRHRGDHADGPAGGVAARRRSRPPTRRSTPRSSGRPRAASASRTPRSTCTAASASTPSTRCFRYFRWTKQIELTLGAATAQLRHFGAMLAERAPDT